MFKNAMSNLITNHYNNTCRHCQYDLETHYIHCYSYQEPVSHIIISDAVAIGILYFILNNL